MLPSSKHTNATYLPPSKRKKRDRWASDSEDEVGTISSPKIAIIPEALPEKQHKAKAAPVVTATQRHNPFIDGCRHVSAYKKLSHISEGTYGIVWKAKEKETGDIVALKEVKMGKECSMEGFPLAALREIGSLLELKHPNIIPVREMVIGDSNEEVYMVMDYMDHDLKVLLRGMKHPFTTSEIKCLMKQLLEATSFMHKNWYIHRDLKPSNLLFNNEGRLFICDYGLARKYGTPVRNYTPLVVTLVYRPPELLLGAKTYDTSLDMWSIGVIFAELYLRDLLFKCDTELGLLDAIFRTVGSPSEASWPGFKELPNAQHVRWKAQYRNKLRSMFPETMLTTNSHLSRKGFDLLSRMLSLNPSSRITAADALAHDWFKEAPVAKPIKEMRKFPHLNAGDEENSSNSKIDVPPEDWEGLFQK